MKNVLVSEEELRKFMWYLQLYGVNDMMEMMRRDAYDASKLERTNIQE